MHQYLVQFYDEDTAESLISVIARGAGWTQAHNQYCNCAVVVNARQAGHNISATVIRVDRDDAKTEDYDFIVYDVWGNAEDGYTVNNSFRSGVVVKIPEWLFDQHTPQDDELFFRVLNEQIGFVSGITADHFEWEGEHAYTLYCKRASDGYPSFELQKRKGHE